jgi:hypothetical protein
MIPKIPHNLADVPVGDAYATALADALVHFLDNAPTCASSTFKTRLLDLARDNAGTSYRCPQNALILAVHLADAVEALAEGATRNAEERVTEALDRDLDADADNPAELEERENDLDLARVLRDETTKLRDAIESATDEARANVPCD